MHRWENGGVKDHNTVVPRPFADLGWLSPQMCSRSSFGAVRAGAGQLLLSPSEGHISLGYKTSPPVFLTAKEARGKVTEKRRVEQIGAVRKRFTNGRKGEKRRKE